MSAESQTQQNNSSLDQLIEAVGNRAKQAAENANPPTSGPGGGDSPTEASYTEGASAKENTALNKEVLGANGPDETPPPEGGLDTMKDREPAQAANVSPTGDDPEGESRQDGPASQAEPGTSSEASLTSKVSAWRSAAGEVAVQFMVDHKLAADENCPDFIKDKLNKDDKSKTAGEKTDKGASEGDAKGETKKDASDATDGSEQYDNIYMIATDGNKEAAEELFGLVQADLAQHRAYGAKLAYEVVADLQAKEEQAAKQQKEAGDKGQAQRKPTQSNGQGDLAAYLRGFKAASSKEAAKKTAMGEEEPMSEPPAADPAMGGGAPPEMGGAEMGGDPAAGASEDEIIAAIMELAAELGMSPEEVIAMLTQEAGGGMEGGMEGEMGGGAPPMPPAAAPDPMKMAAEKLSAEKLAEQRKKISDEQRRLAIKQDAMRTIADIVAIGSR